MTPRCLIFSSVCAAAGAAASARPIVAAAAVRSSLCMEIPFLVAGGKSSREARPMPARLNLQRPHLPGTCGCSRQQKAEIGAGRDVARAHLDELGGELRAR